MAYEIQLYHGLTPIYHNVSSQQRLDSLYLINFPWRVVYCRGPLLFTIYINDLPEILSSYKGNLYADDTAITVVGKTEESLKTGLTTVLETLSPWFKYNRLSLNCSKTQFVIFGTRQSCARVTFDHISYENNTIARASKVKYLGMQLDPLLNFCEHVDYIERKTIGKVKLLGCLNEILTKDTLLMLYKTLVLPIIDYGDIIYDCINQKDMMILQRIQNMALKSILKALRLAPTAMIHEELDMMTLSTRRTLHDAKQMYKIYHGNCPRNVLCRFKGHSMVNCKQTRAVTSGSFEIPKYRLCQSKRNFVYRGIKIWESLPTSLKLIDCIDAFVLSTKQCLLDGDNGIT